ncbi:MAG TPA: hypothetical protein PLV24_05905, partial [Anaerolineaceae bacterium]|nr:hypothetical protein [Anaerolineaceae bacterium]
RASSVNNALLAGWTHHQTAPTKTGIAVGAWGQGRALPLQNRDCFGKERLAMTNGWGQAPPLQKQGIGSAVPRLYGHPCFTARG